MKFRCSRKLAPLLPRVRFHNHRLTYTEVSRPHRRTIRIPLLIAPTSHKRPSRKKKYIYILLLHSHMLMHAHNDAMKTSDTVLEKNIPLILYERVVCEKEMETEQNCNILTPSLMAITAFLSRSPGLLNRWPGALPLWVLVFSTASSLQLIELPVHRVSRPSATVGL